MSNIEISAYYHALKMERVIAGMEILSANNASVGFCIYTFYK